ncbi:hypothetical protein BU24DRAFT_486081 [Aaosphaeria arxii CBS 175.79]|uniref:Uncharacterized protein n=1 Tax=Aaosphaeria arxii CBS 175.79 TaxID=1450172 RepID=A0A6A5XE97_9PLEO|nr:uncharacterized protein BU24DRAFT_486081 [Aaosphaeria arxii CBS 175.79]KAF2011372.1 hypothetical protein BU24DRAFT_486081 [Aaosphaeria arxii CBS 175.79]
MAPGLDLSALANEVVEKDPSTLSTKSSEPTAQLSSKGATVLDPSLITTEFDALRFEAAAFGQLNSADSEHENKNSEKETIQTSSFLISSPYNNPGHYLDLNDLDTSNQIFSKALTALKPVQPDYATAPYTEGLNFDIVLELVRKLAKDEGFQWKEQFFYVVIFRSQLNKDIDNDWLYKLDYESHREACESGGLLKYWFGATNGERRNMATCFWRSREDAYAGGLGPWHKKARAAGRVLYESIVFSTHKFTILDDATDFRFEDWNEPHARPKSSHEA